MDLREQFENVLGYELIHGNFSVVLTQKDEAIKCETICDNFAIGFLLWVYKNAYNYPTKTEEQLLTIYKETL